MLRSAIQLANLSKGKVPVDCWPDLTVAKAG